MPTKSVDLSVIIVSYNTAKTTEKCIKSVIASLHKTQIIYEIIVIDNASTDESITTIKQIGSPSVSIIQNLQNSGFAKANNQGVTLSKGKYILLLNSDTIVLNDAILKMLTIMQQNPDIQFLGPTLLNKDMTKQPSAAPFYSLPVVFAALFLRGDYWGCTRYSPNTLKQVDWVSGACILTTKDNYTSLQGFDEHIFMYMDEVDLLYRAKRMHLNTFFTPCAQVIHLGSASSQGRTDPILQVYKGFLYFYKKHHSATEQYLLKGMLQLKAYLSIWIGRVIKSSYLITTYEKALELAR